MNAFKLTHSMGYTCINCFMDIAGDSFGEQFSDKVYFDIHIAVKGPVSERTQSRWSAFSMRDLVILKAMNKLKD